MELEDLEMLAAASLLAGKINTSSSNGGRTWAVSKPNDEEIIQAVCTARQIWKEVLKKE